MEFANPKAELAYLIAQRGGFLSEHEWWRIREQLELRLIDLSEFVTFVRPHLLNPKTLNPVGMVKSKIRSYAAMRRPASTDEDLRSAEAPAASEKCPICGEVKGKGARIVGGRIVACECATEEWRAKLEKQEEDRLRRASGNDQRAQLSTPQPSSGAKVIRRRRIRPNPLMAVDGDQGD
jgi:hypothetical protein